MDDIMIIGIIALVILALEAVFCCYRSYLERETYRVLAPFYKKRIAEICKDEDMDKTWKDWCETMRDNQYRIEVSPAGKQPDYDVVMLYCLYLAYSDLNRQCGEELMVHRLLKTLIANRPGLSYFETYRFAIHHGAGTEYVECTLREYYERTKDEWDKLLSWMITGKED